MAAQAIGPLLQSTRLDPDKGLYHYHLGLAYVKLGERAKARAALERAVELGGFTEVEDARRQIENVR